MNNRSGSFFFIIIVFIIIFLISVFFNSIKEQTKGINEKGNMFYVNILNFTMPVVKQFCFQEEDLAESNNGILDKLLDSIALNPQKPDYLISREIACLNSKNIDYDTGSNFSLNPFKLNDSDIQKGNSDGKYIDPNEKEPKADTSNTIVPLYDPKLKKALNNSKPEVLIYHTHTTESYSQAKGTDTDNMDNNVCAVGEALAKELQNNYGISVIHDTTNHTAYAYNQAYVRSGETVDSYLKKYGSFKMIIDLHRDSIDDKNKVTAKFNGENVSKFMFVLSQKNNPHFQKNYNLTKGLLDISNKLYPGLSRGIDVVGSGIRSYNQSKSNNAILIEVGTYTNDVSEAKATSKYLARIIGEYINGSHWIK